MAVPVVGRCCWAVLRALGTPHLGVDPWSEGGALEALKQDAALDHGAPVGSGAMQAEVGRSTSQRRSGRSRTPPRAQHDPLVARAGAGGR
eukprot:7738613-Alexandrium_andersonii.AAC.1